MPPMATTCDGLPIWPLRLMAACLVVIIASYGLLVFFGQADIRPGPLTTTLMLLPAMIMLPGLWRGHYKTMVWAALFALFYLLVSSTDAWTESADRGWHLMIAAAATVGFLIAWWHSIRRRRHLKAQVRRGRLTTQEPSTPKDLR